MKKVLEYRIGRSGDGVTRYILGNYARVDKEKIHMDFVTGERDISFCRDLIEDGCTVYSLPASPFKNPFRFRREMKRLWEGGYDIVHCHMSYFLNTILFRQAKKHGVKVILHSHSTQPDITNKWKRRLFTLLHKLHYRAASRYGDAFAACSTAAADWLFGDAVAREKVQIFNNAIDTARFAFDPVVRERVRKELELEKAFVVGHIGRFTYQKNHEFLLLSFACLRKKRPDAVLLLVGGGDLEPEVRRQAAVLGVEDALRFLGLRDDVQELMQAMDVFALPSRFEGLGLVLIEAQTAGLRAVASTAVPPEAKVTELLTYLPLESGPEIWADELLKAADGYERTNRRRQIMEAGYDLSGQAARIEQLYESL